MGGDIVKLRADEQEILHKLSAAPPRPTAAPAHKPASVTAEFDTIFDRIKKAGLSYGDGELNDWNGGRGAYFKDPNGHVLMSVDEMKRLLAVASSLKTRVLLSLGYGCGLRASEIVRLKVKHIDRAQNIIRIEQSKGRKDH